MIFIHPPTYMEKKQPPKQKYPRLSFDLLEMLVLYGSGKYSPSDLAKRYGRYIETITYWLSMYYLEPEDRDTDLSPTAGKKAMQRELEMSVRVSKYQHLIEDNNPGRSYEQYLQDAMHRPVERQYITTYGVTLTEFTLPKEEKGGKRDASGEPLDE